MFHRMNAILMLFIFSIIVHAGDELHFLDKRQLQQLFENKKFDLLETKLDALQRAYEKDAYMEYPIWQAYTTFENADPSYETLLKQWQKTQSNSYVAHYAMGRYYLHLARMVRSTKWASEVLPVQFEEMNRYLKKAQSSFADALKANKMFSEAYVGTIEAGTLNGSNMMVVMTMAEGLKHFPLSWDIRWRYLGKQEPKWGGSMKEIERFVAETRSFYPKNKRLISLDGYADFTRADMAMRRENNMLKALKFVQDAIKMGPHVAAYYLLEGEIYHRVGNFDEELKSYAEAEKYIPQISWVYYTRALAYWGKGDMKQAEQELSKALEFDRYNPIYLVQRGDLYFQIGRQKKAVKDYEDSLLYGKWSMPVLQKLHRYYTDKHNSEKAAYYSDRIQQLIN